jgi:AraC-like DNA-binding protein
MEKIHDNISILAEQHLTEQLPHSIVKELITLISIDSPPKMYDFIRSHPGFESALRVKNFRFFKDDVLKKLGLFEYHFVEIGVPEMQAATAADIYTQRIEACNSGEADELLQLLCEFYDMLNEQGRAGRFRVSDNIVSRCMDYIENSTHKSYTLRDIADALGYNLTYLCQKFKCETGITMHQYSVNCKMEEAATLLSLTNRPLLEISELLCYSSQSHFQRTFKQYFCTTPDKWRKHQQERGRH